MLIITSVEFTGVMSPYPKKIKSIILRKYNTSFINLPTETIVTVAK